MVFLIILFLCTAATAKVTVQGHFAKRNIRTMEDALLFNGMIFICISVFFSWASFGCSAETIICGSIFGLLTTAFQVLYVQALAIGNTSITVMIANLNIVMPLGMSIILYDEPLTVPRIIGILLTFMALIVGTNFSDKATNVKRWLVYALTAFAACGGAGIVQKIYSRSQSAGNSQGFVFWSYFSAAGIAILFYMLRTLGGKRKTFVLGKSALGHALAIGLILGIFQIVYTYSVATFDGTLLYPMYSGGSLLFSAISSVIFLKESLTHRQKISVLIGCMALICMNL